MKALIIEDEIIAADALRLLINELYENVQILDVLQTIDESVKWFNNNDMPDLVFMDIHLADGSSFAIFDEVEITCPIIFTTAYDEYALKAFEVNSVDYLLKPIDKNALKRAIKKYENLSGRTENAKLIQHFIEEIKTQKKTYKRHFLVPERDKLIPLSVNDIAVIFIDTKVLKAVTFDKTTFYLDGTLDEIMSQLNPDLFFRANRQYIISRQAIKDLSVWFGSKLSVNLKIPVSERILISKARVKEFKEWFSGKG